MPDLVTTGYATQTVRTNAGVIQRVGPSVLSNSLRMAPTLAAPGNIFCIAVECDPSTVSVTDITSLNGKVGSPPNALTAITSDATINASWQLFAMDVLEQGSDVLTFAFSADPADFNAIGFEFTANYGPTTQWFNDGNASGDVVGPTTALSGATSGPIPNLPAFYFGGVFAQNTVAVGSTPGFQYTGYTTQDSEFWFLNVTASQTPTLTQSPAGRYMRAAAVVSARQVPALYDTTTLIRFPIVPTGLQRQIYQVMFEVVTDIGLGETIATTYLNGRVLNVSNIPGANQGPPYYTVRPGDDYTVVITGAPLGAQTIAKFFYQESQNGPAPRLSGVV